jgi:bifunctional ADP-heptose synthase (sugar kinase/adenylyltransferase)
MLVNAQQLSLKERVDINMGDILIIGESCRDIFVYCDALRLCPDIPVPVLNVIDQTENGGMAKNVQRNILNKINGCDILTNNNWVNVTKTRYVHEKTNHTFFRVDTPHNIQRINLDEIDYNYKIIVISDYNKGFLSTSDIETICNNHPLVFIDTKKILGEWALNAKFIKINDYEYQRTKDHISKELDDKIIHTIGGDGCEYQSKKYKVKKVDVKDTSGAGDSFMAALVVNYLNTNNIDQAIKYANECASEVVKHRGVSLI